MRNPRETIDISGLGGEYEFACQKMLDAGLNWLKNHPGFDWRSTVMWLFIPELFGARAIVAKTEEAEQLIDCVFKAAPEPPNPNMLWSVLGHLVSVSQLGGRAAWIATIKENDPGRAFLFDGTMESCPPPEVKGRPKRRPWIN